MKKFVYGDEDSVERFWEKVKVKRNGCWEWQAARNEKGYGIFNAKGVQSRLAHRISYYWTHGEISDILTIDHLCFNRACVNPDHLEQCSLVENCMRGNGWAAVNARKTHCPRGHALTDDNLVESLLPWGRRECRTCHNALTHKRFENPEPDWQSTHGHNAAKTHCSRGHLLSDDNLVPSALKFKERKCSTCHAENMAATKERRKAGTVKKVDNHNSRKTHCKNGHELSGDNLRESGLAFGLRQCKACSLQQGKEQMERRKRGEVQKSPNHHNSKKTHCKNGHELTEDNLVVNKWKLGLRVCLICYRAAVKRCDEKRRAAKSLAKAQALAKPEDQTENL